MNGRACVHQGPGDGRGTLRTVHTEIDVPARSIHAGDAADLAETAQQACDIHLSGGLQQHAGRFLQVVQARIHSQLTGTQDFRR